MTALVAAMMTATFFAVRAAARWRDRLGIAALAAILLVPIYRLVTGDISRVLPPQIFSGGADGKDQIILASAAATLCLPVLVGALIWRAGTFLAESRRR